MTAGSIAWVKFTTVVLFISFILMVILLYLPQRHKPYQGAEKLALKDDGDAPVAPRYPEQEEHKRQES